MSDTYSSLFEIVNKTQLRLIQDYSYQLFNSQNSRDDDDAYSSIYIYIRRYMLTFEYYYFIDFENSN